MDEYHLNPDEDDLGMEAPETPEDVAVLYTWANVHGGKYRDFSASRREFRAQQRHRMVEAQREAELEAARAREEAAAREMEEVRRLEEHAHHDEDMRAEAEEARRRAEENIEQERLAARRHVEVAEELKRALADAQREMEEARRRAEDQAARYAEADARYRASARDEYIPGEIVDPYYYAGPLEPTAFAPGKGVRSSVPQRVSSERRIAESYYRSKGTGEVPAQRTEEQVFGLFSDGQRPRGSSAGRRAYTELPPASEVRRDPVPPHFVEGRVETTEDTRERHRPDELDRLADGNSGRGYDDNGDDGYYDGAPVRKERSSDPAARNSAASNVYLPPRVQQASPPPPRAREEAPRPREEAPRLRDDSRSREEARRPREESGERRVVVPSEDPTPGNTHTLDQIRVRRRESTADVNARTARRPRESGVMGVASDSRDEVRLAAPESQERPERVPRPDPVDRYQAVEETRRLSATAEPPARRLPPSPEPGRDARAAAEERPEWLLRDDRKPVPAPSVGNMDRDASSQSVRGAEPARENRQYEERSAARREERRPRSSESQMIPAADGGFNLPPLPDRPIVAAVERTPPAPVRDRATYREESGPRSAAAHVEDRSFRREPPPAPPPPPAPALQPPAPPTAYGDPLPPRPAAERRRVERSSGDRLTRELRVPAPVPAEPEPRERRLPAPAVEDDTIAASRPAGPHPADTLQQSRERVAARWFALKGLMGGASETSAEAPAARTTRDMPVPTLTVVSLSGGVGKTSLVATVGRALSSLGERVLLADATPHGLLPYYFGARELRPDVVRTFSPPPGSKDAAVYMVNYEADRLNGDEAGQTALLEEIGRHVKGAQRLLMDLNGTSAWLARRLAGMNSTILVPVAPDMNSVLGIKGVERFFSGLLDGDGRTQLPYYILNQFDASLPLHLDVREVLRQQLGDRLLPVMIRRSPSVAEALAEGMTVMDYAPESPVTEDYAQLAEWIRKRSAPAQTAMRSIRWSER